MVEDILSGVITGIAYVMWDLILWAVASGVVVGGIMLAMMALVGIVKLIQAVTRSLEGEKETR
jgi:hypothetical protein